MVDILINNSDRNNGNRGVLPDDGGYRLAPIFDNGASFSDKINENRIESLLSNPERLKMSSVDTVTVYGLNDKALSSKKMLRVDNPLLRQALKKNVPLIQS